ncbi:unnamed protein product [Haemonchus placei]|uniref:NTR domain-containing protein n=1 Tax=Haemonchus placei TaxID=6290 RepID=A0A0N4WGL0_HAEPC|nr:unnamed protein product [Haemonchus placei]
MNAVRREPQRNGTESEQSMLTPIPFPRSFYSEPEPSPYKTNQVYSQQEFLKSSKDICVKDVRFSNVTNAQWEGLREIRRRVAGGKIRLQWLYGKGVCPVMSQAECVMSIYRKDGKVGYRLMKIWRLDAPCPVPDFYSLIKTY